MKRVKHTLLYLLAAGAMFLTGCSDDFFGDKTEQHDSNRIQLSGDIDQLAVTRVNDNGFCNGDVMGVYIVDYEGNKPGTLKVNGNRGDNVRHTFDEPNYKWNSAYDLFWKDKHTHIDVYGYYPFANPESIEDYQFEVQKDQSKATENGEMGGYEASDFLWGKVSDVAPTTSVIRLPMAHRMSNARVTLIQGSGFAEGEWANLEKIVLTANVARKASINLSTGDIKTAGAVENTMTIPSRTNDEWRTIVVPQTVAAGTTLFSITIGGVPYKFTKNEAFTYVSGKMMNFGIKVDKQTGSGAYKLTLVSESITPWENDLVSHDATAKEYIVINSTPGGLKNAITAANKDYTQVRNLKITGQINAKDFYFMRDSMLRLSALNLKEVRIKGWGKNEENEENMDDQIPNSAFYFIQTVGGSNSLNRIVLPDTLKSIGSNAFYGCKYLSGSLIIPEGVTEIKRGAFNGCIGLNGILSLPSTLKKLGNRGEDDMGDEGTDYYGGVFQNCRNLTGNLILPDNLELIRGYCFSGCSGLYGELRLPAKLKRMGNCAFSSCSGFTGSLSIPQGITALPSEAFHNCGFNGTLTLHNGITNIANDAFANCHFKGELHLPKSLKVISENAFCNNDFSGTLTLPSTLTHIGSNAFAYNWRLMGILDIPQEVESIGENAFSNCKMLEGIIFPESMETIRQGAFNECYGINSIICKGTMPAHIESGAFDGVAKDNFTLEVPESAISQYQAASGWKDFKRIAAHHELVCRPSVACALSTEHKQKLVINAEGEWEVASKPNWCEVSPASGNKKTEVTLTIKGMAKNADSRDGKVVFRLKDKDYTHECSVSQYGYEYGEDEWITLQKATKGNNGGINIVLLGDGFSAKDIASGKYLKDIKQEVEYFFGIEPYKTYRDYFNVYTAIPLSTESGVGTVNTIRYNRFNTTFTGGVGLKADYDEVFDYALGAPTVNKGNLNQTLIIMVPNSTDYGGICQMWEDGSAIAFCPQSTYGYPLDTRGVIQHEAGGHGFGKLGDEYIYHNAFIDFCDCTCCGHVFEFNAAKSLGWFDNLELTGKMHSVGWSHLIFDDRYSDIVDIYEGGYMHNRGVFRSEPNSCMNNDIPYYSTISRESIVKRIKAYAGETYSFEDFVKNDKRDAGIVESRAFGGNGDQRTSGTYQHAPVFHKGSPLKMAKVRKHR
ncbi:leucine-rich repeat protein [Prevotella copri]|uniref:Leucine-rich repeat protein n=2 Tax=Segatella copri TaxID=165179 RepID=A0AB35ZHD9_9BACT|nr:fimbrillin family protein [Segatella copri]MQN39974.1 leucine-rich repeat protein [Segatella copri]MQN66743.1 leucine-rich repeat protein [Segatella copri]MQO04873.1 leucine-rich repeat protein [Segatella copri]MQO12756.1 leucine-rich repeat protein [Segatella copri]MQO21138.1 leucine-rich repeat protein [Segatella copri]